MIPIVVRVVHMSGHAEAQHLRNDHPEVTASFLNMERLRNRMDNERNRLAGMGTNDLLVITGE